MRQRPEGFVTTVWVRHAIDALLITTALSVAVMDIRLALSSGHDFQWSPSMLMWRGTNPYAASVAGSPELILDQQPNYLPTLYVCLGPLAVLPFSAARGVWAICNLVMLVGAVLLLSRHEGWRRTGTIACLAMTLISAPVVIAFTAGQQSVLVLFLLIVGFQSASLGSGTALGIAISKYSFGPGIVLTMLLRRKWREIGLVAAMSLACTLFLAAWTHTSIVTAAWQPFALGRSRASYGIGDVMTLTSFVTGTGRGATAYAAGAFASVLMTLAARRCLRTSDWVDATSCAALMGLVAFNHLMYDYCVLLPVVFSATRRSGVRRVVLLAVVGFFWFGRVGFVSVLDPGTTLSIGLLAAIALAGFIALVVPDLSVGRARVVTEEGVFAEEGTVT